MINSMTFKTLATTAMLLISTSAFAEHVEVALVDQLDGITTGYCLDIKGGNKDADPADGLQAHSCYSRDGALGDDQVFETDSIAQGQFEMPIYEVCATLESFDSGASIGLETCDVENELQQISMLEDGTIRPNPHAYDNMCLTAGEETRFGRSEDNQMKALSLELCSEEKAAYQTWMVRTES